jgi:hypothetical protein
MRNTSRLAQSFTPNATHLSKIKLKLSLSNWYSSHPEDYEKYPLNVSIRNNLSGEDLVKISKKPYTELHRGLGYIQWVEFDFPDLTIIPGDKYYIVVSCDSPYQIQPLYGWGFMDTSSPEFENHFDSYPRGESYTEMGPNHWVPDYPYYPGYIDRCFITYE